MPDIVKQFILTSFSLSASFRRAPATSTFTFHTKVSSWVMLENQLLMKFLTIFLKKLSMATSSSSRTLPPSSSGGLFELFKFMASTDAAVFCSEFCASLLCKVSDDIKRTLTKTKHKRPAKIQLKGKKINLQFSLFSSLYLSLP